MRHTTKGHRQVKGPDEQDALTPWRKFYCYLQQAGAASKIKRGARRRERREAKRNLKEE